MERLVFISVLVLLLFVAGYYFGRMLDLSPQPKPPPPIQGTGDIIPSHGQFTFNYDFRDTESQNGIAATLNFKHNTNQQETPCDSIALIQIVRTIDLDNPYKVFYFPSFQKKQRATGQGWYVDRGEGYEWVYYGRQNDSTFAAYLTPGKISNSMQVNMRDRPYRPENRPYLGIRWQAVTVPVCVDQDTTKHGYFAWGWTVTSKGEVIDVKSDTARISLVTAVDSAMVKWNQQVGTWGTKAFPDPERLTGK